MGLMPRVLVAAVAGCAVWAAWRFGGGAETGHAPPGVQPVAAVATSVAADAADEVVVHLVDRLDGAHVTMTNLQRGTYALATHWRKMPLAFHDLSAESRRITTSIALRTSATVVPWSVPTGSGKRWTPDARVWNMSEGSFDEREAIFAPTPATIDFRTTVPPNARFVFSPGTANENGDATIFTVSITDAQGKKTTPYAKRFLPEETAHWVDDESVESLGLRGTIESSSSSRRAPTRGRRASRARRATATRGPTATPASPLRRRRADRAASRSRSGATPRSARTSRRRPRTTSSSSSSTRCGRT